MLYQRGDATIFYRREKKKRSSRNKKKEKNTSEICSVFSTSLGCFVTIKASFVALHIRSEFTGMTIETK